MQILKKISLIIIIFSIFIGNNIFFGVVSAKTILSENVKINISKAKIIKSWVINYKKNLRKIEKNYDLKENSVLQKNINKIDFILIKLNKIILNQLAYADANDFLKKVVKDFNSIKKQNSKYLKDILKKVENPENLKKVKKEFDILAKYANKISYKLDSLIYKFKNFLDNSNITSNYKKKELRKSLKKLYVISLKLKNFRKYIYMWKKAPKSTFSILLEEIKKEIFKIKMLLKNK